MNTDSEEHFEEKSFRFSMRTLLLVTTIVCVLGAFSAKFLGPDAQFFFWLIIIQFSIVFAIFYQAYRNSKRVLLKQPAETVMVAIDAKWLQKVRSPSFYLIATLTGVSVTFAPLCLVWCGSVSDYGLLEWIIAPLCLLTIYFVPGFYMRLAGEVLHQLMKHVKSLDESGGSQEPKVN